MSKPKVSVVMPTFNRASYIKSAIDSLLSQTYCNFEIIIVDDASTDNTEEIVLSYKDNRIVYIKNSTNNGVAYTRNVGYKVASGEYIAIADSDDSNHVDRLKKMVFFLEENPNVDVVVTDYQIIDKNGDFGNVVEFRKNNSEFRANLIFQPGLPSFMMFRKKAFEGKSELYHDETFKAAVDYQWYSSIGDNVEIGVIPEVLYYYRRHTNQISTKGYIVQQKYADIIRKKLINKLGIEPSPLEMHLHSSISQQKFTSFNVDIYLQCIKWLTKLSDANYKSKIFKKNIFDAVLTNQLVNLLEYQGYFCENLYNIFLNSRFGKIEHLYSNPILFYRLRERVEPFTKDIYIFGAKKAAYSAGKMLFEMNKDFKGFIDNNKEIVGNTLLGKNIDSIGNLTNINNKYFIISVLSKSRNDISEQLIKNYKVPKKNIIILADLF